MKKVAITLGDPAGIGTEITLKALKKLDRDGIQFFLIGDISNLGKTWSSIRVDLNDNVELIDAGSSDALLKGPSESGGLVSIHAIELATNMAMKGEVDAVVTAPISKESLRLAGSKDIDHTQLFSRLSGERHVSTVFETKNLRILFLTKHAPLLQALRTITVETVINGIESSYIALRLLGIEGKRIGVAAINPHAGENGLLGSEELTIIRPAVDALKEKYEVSGPFPADSVFYQAAEGKFDIVLSMYHDQGHIAAKMLDFHETVSLNTGLPFLRTSVDHGTAFDIAGHGIANESSMISAIYKATKYCTLYRQNFMELKQLGIL